MLNLSKERVNDPLAQYELQTMNTLHTPRVGRVLAYWIIGIFSLLIICLFLPWQQNITGTGQITALTPQDRPQMVPAVIAGRILEWKVREGQFVEAGDTLLQLGEVKTEYFDPALLTRTAEQLDAKQEAIAATREQIEAMNVNLNALQQGLDISLEKARNKVTQVRLKVVSDSTDLENERVQYAIAQRQFNGYDSLYRKGLVSLTAYESRRQKLQETAAKVVSQENKLLETRQELINARLQLTSLQAEYRDKISKTVAERAAKEVYLAGAQAEYSKLRNYYANLEIRRDQYFVTAPQTGYVVRALKTGVGETLKEGDPVVTIMPDQPDVAAEIYVRPMDVPLLHIGNPVRLEFDGWPALQFSGWPSVAVGTFGGRVAVIDYVNSANGKYRVLVTPDPNEEPWPAQLRQGSGVYGWAMLNEVPIWYELWRQLNGFPPSLENMPDAKTAAVEKTPTEK
ncbi:Multidrug resistance efflux pump [Catalinimonas alkaloidigena]|uniref:Multidrug resistance efflux pump n=1 Tax=Catalinimonas alkaloidigena TaxID=1075417 RepID=A0A1G9AV58_9BACT|nr:HlyD family efflux transporter periplasmic adaptor subunit [Catalinimonas alkaloidigena]SDK31162.1 Multidrug resistance efflux pump [Catalinimonas alkaloidigena]